MYQKLSPRLNYLFNLGLPDGGGGEVGPEAHSRHRDPEKHNQAAQDHLPVLNLSTTTSQKCEAVPRRARIWGS